MTAIATSHDRREGGRWTPLQSAKNTLLYLCARVAIAALSPLPRRWLRAMGRALGWVAYAVLPGPRRTTHENLARAMPALSATERTRLAKQVYIELGSHLADTVGLLSPRHDLRVLPIEPSSRRVLDAAVAEGRGVVFISAHLGPWEAVAGSLVAAGVALTAIAREGYDARFTKVFDRLRGKLGVRAIYRGRPGAHVGIIRTLRRGGVLGIPMDLRSRVPTILAPFLGLPAETAVGPARIALRTGAEVVVGTAAPGGEDGLVITVTRIETADLAADAAGEQVLTERINAELSRRILAMPRAWVWMHPRFPEAPDPRRVRLPSPDSGEGPG
jgi:KDO2-lipid IV(A) lauroyltransferase